MTDSPRPLTTSPAGNMTTNEEDERCNLHLFLRTESRLTLSGFL